MIDSEKVRAINREKPEITEDTHIYIPRKTNGHISYILFQIIVCAAVVCAVFAVKNLLPDMFIQFQKYYNSYMYDSLYTDEKPQGANLVETD